MGIRNPPNKPLEPEHMRDPRAGAEKGLVRLGARQARTRCPNFDLESQVEPSTLSTWRGRAPKKPSDAETPTWHRKRASPPKKTEDDRRPMELVVGLMASRILEP